MAFNFPFNTHFEKAMQWLTPPLVLIANKHHVSLYEAIQYGEETYLYPFMFNLT